MPAPLTTTALGLAAILLGAGIVQAAVAVAITAVIFEIVLAAMAGAGDDDDAV